MRNNRRAPAAVRKMDKAFKPLEARFSDMRKEYTYRHRKNTVDVQVWFTHKGQQCRFDYGIDLENRLPTVEHIRNFMWTSLEDYMRTLKSFPA